MTRIRSYTDTVPPGDLNQELDDLVRRIEFLEAKLRTSRFRDGSVTSEKIGDEEVATVNILDSGVTTAKIVDSAVTSAKIATGAVTTTEILDGTIAEVDIDWTSSSGVLAPRLAGYASSTGGVIAFLKTSFTTASNNPETISIDLTDDTLYYPYSTEGVAPNWASAPFVGGITASHATNPDTVAMDAHCITSISSSTLNINYYPRGASSSNIVVLRIILWGVVS